MFATVVAAATVRSIVAGARIDVVAAAAAEKHVVAVEREVPVHISDNSVVARATGNRVAAEKSNQREAARVIPGNRIVRPGPEYFLDTREYGTAAGGAHCAGAHVNRGSAAHQAEVQGIDGGKLWIVGAAIDGVVAGRAAHGVVT